MNGCDSDSERRTGVPAGDRRAGGAGGMGLYSGCEPGRPVAARTRRAPAVLITVWSVWLAPGSDNRLDMPWLVIVKVVVFGLATVALAAARHPRVATIL